MLNLSFIPCRGLALGTLCALLNLGLTGCHSHQTLASLGSGYEEVQHPVHSFVGEAQPPRVSLELREPGSPPEDKPKIIWPSLYNADAVVQDGLVVFVAEVTDAGARNTRPRLFAVKAPELPADITDEVLWRWAKAHGKKFVTAQERLVQIAPGEKAGQLELKLEFWLGGVDSTDEDWPVDGGLSLDWKQVSEIRRHVMQKGVPTTEPRWHTAYLREIF